jgi:hypothetical protein
MDASDDIFATPPDDLIRQPRHRVVARLPGPDEALTAIDAMVDTGIAKSDVYVLCGPEGIRRIDPSGRHHGLKGRIVRTVETIASADDLFVEAADHLAAGGVLVSAPATDDDERKTVQRVLRENGGTAMRYYGALTSEDVGGWTSDDNS